MTVQDVTMLERDVTGSVVSGGGMRMRGATGHGMVWDVIAIMYGT